ncbi:protein MIGRI [Deefgea chitinilytica]|uniref:protein MIGRI n=1 Tax=Deefgea chitinilytica TaxID=570276 RepID=UPI00402B6678
MSGKLLSIFLFFLACGLGWRILLPAQRKELHRISNISAIVLISASVIALIWHWVR